MHTRWIECITCLRNDPSGTTPPDAENILKDVCAAQGKDVTVPEPPSCDSCGLAGSIKGYCVDMIQACGGYCSVS